MTNRLFSALSFVTVLGGTLLACAPPGGDVAGDDGADSEEDNLGTSQRSYVTIERDFRKCAYPMCSGWYVTDVNRKNPKRQYVASLVFSGDDADAIRGQVESAPAGEVVLHGKLVDLADWEDPAMLSFEVSAAWRGMPGQTVDKHSRYYAVAARDPQITCFTAPCSNVVVHELHKTKETFIDRVDTTFIEADMLNHDWIGNRLVSRGGLAAGVLVETDENDFPGGPENVLLAEAAFIRLPEHRDARCPQSKPDCPEGQPASYSYDADRCVVLDGCVEEPMFCALYIPSCSSEAYTQVSWPGGNGCTAYACEPTWVAETDVVDGGGEQKPENPEG